MGASYKCQCAKPGTYRVSVYLTQKQYEDPIYAEYSTNGIFTTSSEGITKNTRFYCDECFKKINSPEQLKYEIFKNDAGFRMM
jgi:hypothetical protein